MNLGWMLLIIGGIISMLATPYRFFAFIAMIVGFLIVISD